MNKCSRPSNELYELAKTFPYGVDDGSRSCQGEILIKEVLPGFLPIMDMVGLADLHLAVVGLAMGQ
jgi:hypothetical protein